MFSHWDHLMKLKKSLRYMWPSMQCTVCSSVRNGHLMQHTSKYHRNNHTKSISVDLIGHRYPAWVKAVMNVSLQNMLNWWCHLAPNDIISARWQRSYPGYFGFTSGWWEERRPCFFTMLKTHEWFTLSHCTSRFLITADIGTGVYFSQSRTPSCCAIKS